MSGLDALLALPLAQIAVLAAATLATVMLAVAGPWAVIFFPDVEVEDEPTKSA